MILPLDFEQRIGFDKIRELIFAECNSPLGEAIVQKMNFVTNFEKIESLLIQTSEFVSILQSGEYFPSSNYIDVSHFIKRAKVTGTFFSEEEFFDLKLSLKTILDCISFLDQFEEEYPNLFKLRQAVSLDGQLYKAIDAIIDDRGEIRNNASPALQTIRSSIFKSQAQLRRLLENIYKKASADKLTPEDASVTIRDGRLVIPVLAEYKRRVKGFVHDQSATGQTVYIEPTEALELNNEVREYQYAEKREVVRLLTQLTSQVQPQLESLEKAYKFLGIIDFIRAKARFSMKIGGYLPKLRNSRIIDFKKAEHPLLKLSLAENKKR